MSSRKLANQTHSHPCFAHLLGQQVPGYFAAGEGSVFPPPPRRPFYSNHDKVSEAFHKSGAARLCPPDNSAHISAHNAVKTHVPIAGDSRALVQQQIAALHRAKLDENYAKACRRAEKKGRQLPPKEEYYNHWGYSYYSQ